MSREDIVRELFAQNKTDAQIGAAVGLTAGSLRNYRSRVLGLKRPMGHVATLKRHPPLDYDYIKAHYTGPESIKGIADALDTSPRTIRRALWQRFQIRVREAADPERLKQADTLLDGTIPYGEVGTTVGLTVEQLKYHFPGRGLKVENYGPVRQARQLEKELGL